jgi:CTP:molybdopterin cytidylyltransferase MocA
VTVAAIVQATGPASALADAEGQPAARRIAEVAWSGGAIPIVVVAPDPSGALAEALRGTEARRVEPGPMSSAATGQLWRGIEAALELVSETDAVLVWPDSMAWLDPETITSLIESHGAEPDNVLRPEFDDRAGWPVLVPLASLEALRGLPDPPPNAQLFEALEAAGATARRLDLGDPGATHSIESARADLPPYRGPAEPASGHTHEWGEATSEEG